MGGDGVRVPLDFCGTENLAGNVPPMHASHHQEKSGTASRHHVTKASSSRPKPALIRRAVTVRHGPRHVSGQHGDLSRPAV
ncbi:hypothetical protein RRG08_019048 [Elysia crispata]|uniref:Uncharacterized protein n=1 Tax=Elysia crispata TaxID=231223 RepID=A0AAE1A748_9GAST|nr:hypothetical protein RRG08_019048 [Elysia crispata]